MRLGWSSLEKVTIWFRLWCQSATELCQTLLGSFTVLDYLTHFKLIKTNINLQERVAIRSFFKSDLQKSLIDFQSKSFLCQSNRFWLIVPTVLPKIQLLILEQLYGIVKEYLQVTVFSSHTVT